ncbi:MAG: shikimate kinase [Bacillota bacterium]
MNIILIGFMGAGKTSVGKRLAKLLCYDFYDTDVLIEEKAGISIKEMFEQQGETAFRQLENQVIKDLRGIKKAVISVGGGAVMYHNNFELLKAIGITVFLYASIENILRNVKSSYRPLLGAVLDVEKTEKLYNSRLSTYLKADVVIEVKDKDILQLAEEIVQQLRENYM